MQTGRDINNSQYSNLSTKITTLEMVDTFHAMHCTSYKYSEADIFWLRIHIVLWTRDINNMLDYVSVWTDEFEKITTTDHEWRSLLVWSTWTKVVLPDPAIPSTKIHVGRFDCPAFWSEQTDGEFPDSACGAGASAIVVDIYRISCILHPM